MFPKGGEKEELSFVLRFLGALVWKQFKRKNKPTNYVLIKKPTTKKTKPAKCINKLHFNLRDLEDSHNIMKGKRLIKMGWWTRLLSPPQEFPDAFSIYLSSYVSASYLL